MHHHTKKKWDHSDAPPYKTEVGPVGFVFGRTLFEQHIVSPSLLRGTYKSMLCSIGERHAL